MGAGGSNVDYRVKQARLRAEHYHDVDLERCRESVGLVTYEQKSRICLRCGIDFLSDHRGVRQCSKCRS